MDLGISGRTALVTGGSQGIGLATVEVLASEGVNVAIAARDEARLRAAAEQVQQLAKGDVHYVEMDALDSASVRRAVIATEARFGPVEILVNNVGGVENFGSFDDLSEADWLGAMDLNLLSALRCSLAVLPGMRGKGWGRIVNISSESAIQPESSFPHYAAAKSAILSFTKSLSKANAGTGVRVNAVSPVFVMTPPIAALLTGMAEVEGVTVDEAEKLLLQRQRPGITARRPGQPEEVARVIRRLEGCR